MAKNIKNKVTIKLSAAREKLSARVDVLIQCLECLRQDNDGIPSQDDKSYIQIIYDNSLLLRETIMTLLADDLLEKNLEDNHLTKYLEKVRHDLRNPINIISGYTEIILEDCNEENIHAIDKYLAKLTKLLGRILKLIDRIKSPDIDRNVFQLTDEHAHKDERTYVDEDYRRFKESLAILIVDDVDENCQILKYNLQHLGYVNIAIAHDGFSALSMLETNKFDLVLLDIEMPGLTGVEVLSHLQKDIVSQKIKVLVISGYDAIGKSIECIKLGAEDFLLKPFNTDLLRVRVNVCIEKMWFLCKEEDYHKQIGAEKRNYESLLYSIFPPVVVSELVKTGQVEARYYRNVAVLFADVVNFTHYCDIHKLSDVIKHLQALADVCESSVIKHNLQKIKTIGDGFLAVSGMLMEDKNSVLACIECAQEIIKQNANLRSKWEIRVGINYGTIIGGIIGHRQYQFDIWGDTVNTTSRIQQLAKPNKILLSKSAWLQVTDQCHSLFLGKASVKGKNPIEVFELNNTIK